MIMNDVKEAVRSPGVRKTKGQSAPDRDLNQVPFGFKWGLLSLY